MIRLMNYNVSRSETGKSQLDKIQSAYLKSLHGKDLTLEQLEKIEAFLITNSAMMDQPEMYTGLERNKVEFELLKQDVLSKTSTVRQTFQI